ncbi:eukaryotic translation initiation factor 3 subunit I [Zootermopsis nevadensis]|uniref:eukaryotic translation initiation factor 3 subunit I n=1 Tax=Zootermopsis nevadensis TaxID=136037 RepID=UPI000B8E42E8|nr:eukaryotic translation initiation factor 3 subunit I [Zootermopsis nevadensis]
MKPLMLHGHERPITQIKYNREGDLLFSSAKDLNPNVWYSLNGERLGTFDGHQGAVWAIDVNWDTTRFMSGAADQCLRIWDCATGSQIGKIENSSSVRSCNFSYSANMAAYSTDAHLGQLCEILIIDTNNMTTSYSGKAHPILRIPIPNTGPKVTSMLWGPLDKSVITGHENGELTQWDLRMGKTMNSTNDHSGSINDMQMSKHGIMFITASKDYTARLFDTDTLSCLKTYKTERPVNSAAISPIYDHVVVGGGQDAMDVTTTSTRIGKFDSRFFHLVFEEEFGRVKGHFGPINSVAFHPDGKSYSSGGEDGYIRIHNFDSAYFEFNFDCQ